MPHWSTPMTYIAFNMPSWCYNIMGCQRVYLVGAIHLSTAIHTAFNNEARVCIGLLLVCHNILSIMELKYDHPLVGLALLGPVRCHIIRYVMDWTDVHTLTCVRWESCHSHTPKWCSDSCHSCNHVLQVHTMFHMTSMWVGIMNHALVIDCMLLRSPDTTNKYNAHEWHRR